jgi:hypothetical protein
MNPAIAALATPTVPELPPDAPDIYHPEHLTIGRFLAETWHLPASTPLLAHHTYEELVPASIIHAAAALDKLAPQSLWLVGVLPPPHRHHTLCELRFCATTSKTAPILFHQPFAHGPVPASWFMREDLDPADDLRKTLDPRAIVFAESAEY